MTDIIAHQPVELQYIVEYHKVGFIVNKNKNMLDYKLS